nr:MAG TPA: hypothetical protein [Inoviridae sp.]
MDPGVVLQLSLCYCLSKFFLTFTIFFFFGA